MTIPQRRRTPAATSDPTVELDVNNRKSPTLLRASALLTGVGTLSAAFVMAPAMTVAVPQQALPAAGHAVRPATETIALRTHVVRTAAQSGPTTAIATKTYTSTAAKQRAASIGQASDAVVEVPATGDLVAVTWPRTQTGLATATVLVRVRTDAGWQDWHTVSIDSTNGEGDRVGTEPVWAPGARSVQIRVAKGDRSLLQAASLATITSPRRAADAALTPTSVPGAASAAYAPTVISRAQWGADESMRPCPTEYSRTTKAVVVHHTADTNNYSAADSARMLRSIYAYDTQTLGWCDIAYNAIVDKYGQIFEGRAGGLNKPVKGAHAYAFNNDTFGVSILGNYELVPVPWAGFDALASVIAMRLDSFYLDAYSKVQLTSAASGSTTRYPAGTVVTLDRINGHKDTSYTLCPGKYLYPRLAELRDLVSSKLTYTNSPIYKKSVAMGGAAVLGPVTVGETTVWPGTRATKFDGGRRIYSSWAGTYAIGGGTEAEWLRYGGAPKLGQLATDETSTTYGTYTRLTSGRYITWARSGTGTFLVNGGILTYWLKSGGAWTSPYGMATGDITGNSLAWWQPFTNGHIYFTRAGSSFGTLGAIDTAYFAAGGPNGSYGLPTSAAYSYLGGTRQDFTGGSIIISSTGQLTLKRR